MIEMTPGKSRFCMQDMRPLSSRPPQIHQIFRGLTLGIGFNLPTLGMNGSTSSFSV